MQTFVVVFCFVVVVVVLVVVVVVAFANGCRPVLEELSRTLVSNWIQESCQP